MLSVRVIHPGNMRRDCISVRSSDTARANKIARQRIFLHRRHRRIAVQHCISSASTKEKAAIAAGELIRLGAKTCLVTMSDQGTILHDGMTSRFIESYQVQAIDSTAAGDAFAGAFAVNYVETKCLNRATRFASAAGALCATKRGAQPSMPNRNEILAISE